MEPYTDIRLLNEHAKRCIRATDQVRNRIAMALDDDSNETLSESFDAVAEDLFQTHGVEASQSFADVLLGENAANVLMLRTIDASDIEAVANSALGLIRPMDHARSG